MYMFKFVLLFKWLKLEVWVLFFVFCFALKLQDDSLIAESQKTIALPYNQFV